MSTVTIRQRNVYLYIYQHVTIIITPIKTKIKLRNDTKSRNQNIANQKKKRTYFYNANKREIRLHPKRALGLGPRWLTQGRNKLFIEIIYR